METNIFANGGNNYKMQYMTSIHLQMYDRLRVIKFKSIKKNVNFSYLLVDAPKSMYLFTCSIYHDLIFCKVRYIM